MKLLIIDDNPDALTVLERFLKTLDHQVASYTDAREALLWIKEDKPEMIIADLDMPGMDGYEFVRRLRGFASFVSVPVLCITGTEATDADILAGGFAAVLRKPTTLSDVMTSIEEVRAGVAPGPAPNS